DHRRAAAIGQDHVEAWKGAADDMALVGAHLVQGGGGVDVPEDAERIGAAVLDDAFEQFGVEDADAARLDDDVRRAGFFEDSAERFGGGFIDHGLGPFGRLDVLVLLPVEGVGFVENDVVAAQGEVSEQAAIISRGAVPVRGEQAGAVKCDLHAVSLRSAGAAKLSAMESNSRARWAQVWRVRMVSRPLFAREARRAGSFATSRRRRVISSPSWAIR